MSGSAGGDVPEYDVIPEYDVAGDDPRRKPPSLSRQFLAGVATIPSEIARAGAMAINPLRAYRQITGQATPQDELPYGGASNTLQTLGDKWNETVNRVVGVDDPSVLDNTGEAVARFLGGSLPAAPLRLPGMALRAIAGTPSAVRTAANVPLRVAELMTPLSITSSKTVPGVAGAVAANVGTQTAVAGALEYNLEPRDPTVPYDVYDVDGNLVGTRQADHKPGVGRVVARSIDETVGDHPIATAIGGGLTLAGGIIGARHLSALRRQREIAAQSDIYGPLDRTSSDVPIIDNPVRDAANTFAEITQDANIRTKDAVRQADPAGFNPTRDAIDMAIEPAHKARVLQAAETGIIETPRGTRRTEALSRISEDLAHESLKKPELNTKVKELIILESEADSRLYAMRKGKANSVEIDVTTGLAPTAQSLPANIQKVTPRATLHKISDQDLARRINDIRRNDPDAVRYAERYWKLHRDLADAWVDWGLVSKRERALWGRANPQFMHTVNLDNPKSPRTYRIREHAGGPEKGGDPFLAATEYIDFMMGYAYKNRRNRMIVESLRKGQQAFPGAFGNSKWLGRVAHPAELRRTYKPGTQTPMTKADVPITGDSIKYYDDGEVVEVEVRNPQLYHTMTTMPTHASSLWGWMRQIAQSGMTGKLALLVMQPFAIANATMGGLFGYISRPAGRSFGLLDAYAQKLTTPLVGKTILGKTIKAPIGVRGDPTAVLGMIGSATADTAALVSRAVGEAFANSFKHGGTLSKLPGAAAIGQRATRAYLNSMHARSSRIGSGNASTLGDQDFDTGGRASLVSTITPHGNLARVISDPQDWKEQVELLAARSTPADIKIAVRLFADINEAIGNMAQSFIFRTNQGKANQLSADARVPEVAYAQAMMQAQPFLDRSRALFQQARALKGPGTGRQQKLLRAQARAEKLAAQPYLNQAKAHENDARKAYEAWFNEMNNVGTATRQLLGDPGMMGSGLRDYGRNGMGFKGFIGFVGESTPYANIGAQATGRMIQAARENPMGTAAAVGLVLGPMAILPIANAIRLDNERMERGEEPIYVPYDLGRPAHDVTRFITGYIGGLNPDEAPRLRVDPFMSFAITLFREAFIEYMGLKGDPRLDPTVGDTREAILRIANMRTWENITTSALNAQPVSQFPPAFGAGFAAAGQELPPFEKFISRGGANPIPTRGMGAFDQTRLANDVASTRVEAVAGQIAGGTGLTIVGAIRSGWQAEQRKPGSFTSAAIDEVLGRARDRLPEVQPLWDQPAKRATSDQVADIVNAKEQVMRAINEAGPNLTSPGVVGPGRYGEVGTPGGGAQGVDDPEMRQLMNAIKQFSGTMGTLQQARAKVRKLMLDTEQQGLPYADRRLRLNEYADEVRRINKELLARYTMFEDAVSERLGVRVRIDALDPTQPLTQFRPLD